MGLRKGYLAKGIVRAMYAIIQDSGRQIKVVEGQELDIDYREVHAGDEITFDKVLAHSNGSSLTLGSPSVSGAKVTAKVVGVVQGPKLVVQKLRRRKASRRRTGHRQLHTRVKIEAIAV
jgi:large subunit ribosomal protein L21